MFPQTNGKIFLVQYNSDKFTTQIKKKFQQENKADFSTNATNNEKKFLTILWEHGRTYPAIEIAANKSLYVVTPVIYVHRGELATSKVLQLLKNDEKNAIA